MKMSKIAALAAALALVAASVHAQPAGYAGATRNIVQSPDGSYYNTATNQRTDANGAAMVTDAAPPWSLNTVVWITSNVTIAAQNKYYTAFYPVAPFTKMQLQVSWTDSLKTQASIDSTCFEIFPIGKVSQTSDGFDYFMDLDPGTATANTDTSFVGYCVGSASSPYFTAECKYDLHSPTQIIRNGDRVLTAYNVSIPLTTRSGTYLQADVIGFMVRNCNRGSTGISNLRGLSIALVEKAN